VVASVIVGQTVQALMFPWAATVWRWWNRALARLLPEQERHSRLAELDDHLGELMADPVVAKAPPAQAAIWLLWWAVKETPAALSEPVQYMRLWAAIRARRYIRVLLIPFRWPYLSGCLQFGMGPLLWLSRDTFLLRGFPVEIGALVCAVCSLLGIALLVLERRSWQLAIQVARSGQLDAVTL
jgi:hypothetical protein